MLFFNKFKSKDATFTQIFFSLAIGITLAILIVSSLLFLSFQSYSIDIINSLTRDSLKQISYSASFLNNTARTLAMQVYYDAAIQSISYASPTTQFNDFDIWKRIETYRYTSTAVDSVYVYNPRKDLIYYSAPFVSGHTSNISQFFDKDIVQRLQNIRSYSKLNPIIRTIPESYGDNVTVEQKVYTYLFYDSAENSLFSDENIVVINISVNWMTDMIKSMNAIPDSKVLIIDNEGNSVLSDINKTDPTWELAENFLNTILKSSQSSGYFTMDRNKNKFLISYDSSDVINWRFIYVIPYHFITGKINQMKIQTLMIGFIIFILGIPISFFISKKLYNPISSIIAKMSSLQLENRKYASPLKQDLLKDMLSGSNDLDMETAGKRMKDLNISIEPNGHFQLVIFKIDGYSEFCLINSLKNQNLYKFAIMNISSELLSASFKTEAVDMKEDHVVIICNAQDSLTLKDQENVREVIRNIQLHVNNYFTLSLSAACSRQVDSFLDLSSLYTESLEALNYRLIYGHQCIIDVEKCRLRYDMDYSYPSDLEKQLTDSLIAGKLEEVKKIYSCMIDQAASCSYAIINSLFLRLSVAINLTADIIHRNTGLNLPYEFRAFTDELSRLETLEEVNAKFFSLFDTFIPKYDDNRKAKHEQLFRNATKIIQENYLDTNLSLDSIADKLEISSAQLSRIFKQYAMKSVFEYINDVRMEKARELLDSTNYSVNEISEKSGFPSSGYFYSIFKKMNGITPSQYRQRK